MPNFRTPRIIGRIVKWLIVLFVLAINALLIWRVFFSTVPPKEISTMIAGERLSAAYAQYGDELQLLYQDQASITRAENNYGYFSVTQCVFIPEAGQVQIVVRYNNSTIRHLKEDYALEEMPSREDTLFDVTLVKTTDLTPDDPDDNLDPAKLSRERYSPSEGTVRATTALYTYCRYVFEGVCVDDLTVGVFADIYYVEDIDYDREAYGTLCLYDNLSEWLEYDLTKADRESLAAKAEP